MDFTKMHGLGNDYICIACLGCDEPDGAKLARAMCDRHLGVGADGLILIASSRVADFRMRIFNPDGSEAEMCGNGIRCLAKYVFDHGLTSKKIISIETLAGLKLVELYTRGGVAEKVKVNMGKPSFLAEDIPVQGLSGEAKERPMMIEGRLIKATFVSMGNPHCVIFVDDSSGYPVSKVGPAIERHPLFPRRINVNFVEVVSRSAIKVRTWERGAGETLACGTGACASVAACALLSRTGRAVSAHLPGGSLEIDWDEDGPVYMTGPAVEIFSGQWRLPL